MTRLYLASTSPRRSWLLTAAKIAFVPVEPGEEVEGPREPVARVVARARSKARGAVVAGLPPGVVLGVDTIVVLDGIEFGKPRDRSDAARMLRTLSGREHEVLTGHALLSHPIRAHAEWIEVARARVRCAPLDAGRITAHVESDSWRGKAGGYGIQDSEVEFMSLMDGDLDTVIGLSIGAVRRLFDRGVPGSARR